MADRVMTVFTVVVTSMAIDLIDGGSWLPHAVTGPGTHF